jgi:DnaJ-class molecular chaperone
MRFNRNPWDILGISHGASSEEVKQAYKRKAMESHPDRNGDPEIFKLITDAYSQLKNKSHIPILSQPDHKLVNVKLSIKDQIMGINGIIYTNDGTMIETKIPKGVLAGEKFKIKSEGKNYIINIQEEKHKLFTRQGNNVIIDLNVDIVYALVGGTFKFTGPCDEDLEVSIPAGTKPNSLFVLDQKGLYNRKRRQTGNLHIFVNFDLPILDTEQDIEDFIKRLKK